MQIFNKYNILILVLIVLLFILVLTSTVLISYSLGKKQGEKICQSINPSLNSMPIKGSFAGKLEPGQVGEDIKENQPQGLLVGGKMPEHIFSVSGMIQEVREDSLIVSGDGSNFADGVSRNLTCILTSQTLTFTLDRHQYQGQEGLNVLQSGMKIVIESDENIRGKTQFDLTSINIIQ